MLSPEPARVEPPALATISFDGGRPLRIKFKFAVSSIRVPTVEISDDRPITEAWERAGRALDDLVKAAPRHETEAANVWQPLRELLAAGRELGQRLMKGNDAWNELQRAFTQVRRLRWPQFDPLDIPVVKVVAYDGAFPLELLPVFLPAGGQPETKLKNDLDLMRMAERFLGFTTVVRRVAPNAKLRPATFPNDPELAIQFLRYRTGPDSEDGFAQEEKFLASLGAVDVDGPWPMADLDEDEVIERVIDVLFDAGQCLTRSGKAASLAHFACHCHTLNRASERYELVLSTDQGTRRPIEKRRISDGYSERGEQHTGAPPERAAIFLNACGTSTIDPRSAQSFQTLFLDNRHPAFLGTNAAIPDRIAADYAEFLYLFLLGGFTLGESVLLARRYLLLSAKSPLGMLYALHGNDLLGVAVKHPGMLPEELRPAAA